jgi:alkanesulfonate monooxygenase SsuD/methylene tetrahydromethanopterin reductase-like flavin-dependent oxidoreductase (luciferase family)
MLRLAGRHGDGAILNWLSVEDVRRVAPIVHAGGPGKQIVARLFVIPTADRGLARAIARRAAAAYLTVPVYAAYHEWLGRGEALASVWSHWKAGDRKAAVEALSDAVVDDLVIHGAPEACREHVERYREAGVTTPRPRDPPCRRPAHRRPPARPPASRPSPKTAAGPSIPGPVASVRGASRPMTFPSIDPRGGVRGALRGRWVHGGKSDRGDGPA